VKEGDFAVGDSDAHPCFPCCLLFVSELQFIGSGFGSGWRGPYNVSHRQSGDHSNEGSRQSPGQDDERFPHGSRDALNWFSGHRHIGSSIWRRARARTHVDRLFDPHFGSISSPSRAG